MLDLLAIDGDPLPDITVMQGKARIKLVMEAGEAYVDEISPDQRYVRHPGQAS